MHQEKHAVQQAPVKYNNGLAFGSQVGSES